MKKKLITIALITALFTGQACSLNAAKKQIKKLSFFQKFAQKWKLANKLEKKVADERSNAKNLINNTRGVKTKDKLKCKWNLVIRRYIPYKTNLSIDHPLVKAVKWTKYAFFYGAITAASYLALINDQKISKKTTLGISAVASAAVLWATIKAKRFFHKVYTVNKAGIKNNGTCRFYTRSNNSFNKTMNAIKKAKKNKIK